MNAPQPKPAPATRVFSPYELNDLVNRALADNLAPLWIEGELGDVSERSGHVYFSLRDPSAIVRGVMFASDVRRVRHLFADGLRVRLKVVVGIYVPRGSFQIQALVALATGEGDRAAEIARLRAKLEAEGLLHPSRKRPLPRWPMRVGIVTSRSGAALHDVLEVARSRMPAQLILVHATVQGMEAPSSIVSALGRLSQLPLDVILLVRGGGAQEDLSAFDDERVARAIVRSAVPVVCGVGHEVDVTTADLVADVRAATPSHAAELAIPAREAGAKALLQARTRVDRALRIKAHQWRQRSERMAALLRSPERLLLRQQGRLDALRATLERALHKRVNGEQRALASLRTRLEEGAPEARLVRTRATLTETEGRLHRAMKAHVERGALHMQRSEAQLHRSAQASVPRHRGQLIELLARLHALSPIGILSRGYAIALHTRTSRALLRASDAKVGDRLAVRLSEGTLLAEVVAPDADRAGE
jgi:exodeoxyribonuclease VII large subunit